MIWKYFQESVDLLRYLYLILELLRFFKAAVFLQDGNISQVKSRNLLSSKSSLYVISAEKRSVGEKKDINSEENLEATILKSMNGSISHKILIRGHRVTPFLLEPMASFAVGQNSAKFRHSRHQASHSRLEFKFLKPILNWKIKIQSKWIQNSVKMQLNIS